MILLDLIQYPLNLTANESRIFRSNKLQMNFNKKWMQCLYLSQYNRNVHVQVQCALIPIRHSKWNWRQVFMNTLNHRCFGSIWIAVQSVNREWLICEVNKRTSIPYTMNDHIVKILNKKCELNFHLNCATDPWR